MIIKNFDFGWQGVKSVELQKQILTDYLQKYYTDQSNTVLVNTTWLSSKQLEKTNNKIDQQVNNYASLEYDIFAGLDWPDLNQILQTESFEHLSETVKLEVLDFKFKIFQYQTNLEVNTRCSPQTQVKNFIEEHKPIIDNVIVYSFLDPPRILSFLDDQPFNVIKIGGNPKPNIWIDFHAMLVDKFLFVSPNLSNTANLIDVPFMCLNGKPHPHRYNIVKELIKLKLDKLGFVSFGGQAEELKGRTDYIGLISIPEKHKKITGVDFDIFDAMTLGDIDNWNRHFLNIVTETNWNVEKVNWWSEKIFKPILGYRPFLVYTPNGCVNMLTEHGFLHYCNDFTDISDLDLTQPDNIPVFLKELCAQPTSYLTMKYDQLFEKIQFNRERFDSYVLEQWELVTKGLCSI